MNNENFFKNNQLVVSYELLQLLRWIVTDEPEMLKMLVQHAIDNNCIDFENNEGSLRSQEALPSHEELQQTIVNFFDILESTLQDIHSSEHNSHVHYQSFLPAIDHIDSALCGENTIAISVAQASTQLQRNTKQTAQETLYKELLKNWRPRSRDLAQ